jgi:glycosyltransferase involved in cell wall biosynthesis
MRILFDARSVRTPAGTYVFQGLTQGWRSEDRVSAVLAAVSPDFDPADLPDGVEPISISNGSWLHHLTVELPRAADRARADILFVPNGLPPRDSRSVIYFQDLHQFTALTAPGLPLRSRAVELARGAWRRHSAPVCRLAIPVSSDIHHQVVRRLPIPVTMIPNGVDVGGARWTGGADRVVVMGGHGARKGEDVALRAWANLPLNARRGLQLDIIGAEPSERRRELLEMTERLRIANAVSIAGAMPRYEFLERVASSMLALSCSRLEAFGLPVAEALAMGAPLLASDLPSHRELVARAGAGALFTAGDAGSLAKELATALQGRMPARLMNLPLGWSWRERARQHVDAYHENA